MTSSGHGIRYCSRLFVGVLLSAAPAMVFAAFTFNWGPLNGTYIIPDSRCNVPSFTNQNCATNRVANPDPTRFVQETVNEGGVNYYHVVVGDPAAGFASEVYIRQGGVSCNGFAQSTSPGNCNNDANVFAAATGVLTGSGSGGGHPNYTVMKQVLNDADINQVFFKGGLNTKPVITQDIVNAEIDMRFSLDMSNSDYNTSTTTGIILNTLTLFEPGLSNAADYNFATDNQFSTVTAGRYSWATGPGYSSSYGTYTYETGGFGIYSVDWLKYRSATQNPSGGGCSGPC